uniref:Uncharacterized protein n=1 Tax=Arundo donax TaxID=35708 RepID=A0A0A8XVU0_ARUDO
MLLTCFRSIKVSSITGQKFKSLSALSALKAMSSLVDACHHPPVCVLPSWISVHSVHSVQYQMYFKTLD